MKPTPQPAAPAQAPAPAMSSPVAPTTTLATPAKQTVAPVVVSANPAAEKTIKMVQNTNALASAVNQQAQQNAMSGYVSTDPTIQAKIAEMQRQATAQSSQAPQQAATQTAPAATPSAPTQQAKTYWEPVLGQYVQGDIDVDKPWQKYGLGSANALYNTDVNTLKALAAGNQNRGIDVGASGQVGEYTKPTTGTTAASTTTQPLPYQGEIDRLQRETDDLQKKYLEDFEKMRQGQIPLTEGQQLQLDTIKRQFDDVIQQQKVYNENYTQMTNLAGVVSGRNRYAPEIALGQIKKTVDDGVAKIGSLNLQALDTLFQVKQAMQQENWKMLDASYAKLDQFMQRRQKTFQDMQDKLLDQAEKVKAANRQAEQDKISYSKEVAPGLADGLTYLKSDGSIYQPTEDEILATAKTSGIDANILRSNVQKQISKIREDQKKKADKELEDLNKDKRDLLDSAAKNSAPQSVINAINKAKTYAEAIQAGGEFLANATGIVGEYNFYKRQEEAAGRVPMSFNAFQDADANRKKPAADTAGLPTQVANQVDMLARNFKDEAIVKDYVSVQEKKLLVDSILKNGVSGPSDVALVYTFMKSLDPASVVRESEFETARKSGNIFSGAFAKYNGYFKDKGGSLPETVKQDFSKLINTTFGVKEQQYNNLRNEYARKINKKTGDVDGEDYLINYGGASTAQVVKDAMDAALDWAATNKALYEQEKNFLRENGITSQEEIADYISRKYLNKPFSSVGGDTKPAAPVKRTGMRTDRHNNPTAFTTDIARIAGLREGVDYEKGDPFDNGRFHTARLLGDPVATTIKVIDNIGFYTQGGKQRWSHTAIPQDRWNAMTYEQKKQVVKKMYGHEGGKELNNIFA